MVLTDESPMPFGKHKGTTMANVPAKYLQWAKEKLYPNNPAAKDVLKYVMDNWDAIKKELPDESREN